MLTTPQVVLERDTTRIDELLFCGISVLITWGTAKPDRGPT